MKKLNRLNLRSLVESYSLEEQESSTLGASKEAQKMGGEKPASKSKVIFPKLDSRIANKEVSLILQRTQSLDSDINDEKFENEYKTAKKELTDNAIAECNNYLNKVSDENLKQIEQVILYTTFNADTKPLKKDSKVDGSQLKVSCFIRVISKNSNSASFVPKEEEQEKPKEQENLKEGLSRGSLYRRRYYGRY